MRTDTALVILLAASLAACSPAEEEAAPPAIEAGTSLLSVNVSGMIELQ